MKHNADASVKKDRRENDHDAMRNKSDDK